MRRVCTGSAGCCIDEDGFVRNYYVASSVCEMGMLRVELEAIDE